MNTAAAPILTLKRTDSFNPDFLYLVSQLDADLQSRYGEQQKFFDQFNKLARINNVIVAHLGETPAGCGAFKEFDAGVVEIKRMFVSPAQRGKGIGGQILKELETWAAELNYKNCILETAKSQPEAIKLYYKSGYVVTENYGPYIGVEISVCMKKGLK